MATVDIEGWSGPWDDDDPDAAFKARVAQSARLDPLATLERLGAAIGVPVGGLVHHVLAEWASAGSGALLELGPTEVERLRDLAHADGPEADVLARLRGRIDWLAAGIDAS